MKGLRIFALVLIFTVGILGLSSSTTESTGSSSTDSATTTPTDLSGSSASSPTSNSGSSTTESGTSASQGSTTVEPNPSTTSGAPDSSGSPTTIPASVVTTTSIPPIKRDVSFNIDCSQNSQCKFQFQIAEVSLRLLLPITNLEHSAPHAIRQYYSTRRVVD